ncbi:MAG: hypothetical protein ACOYZ8_14230 [Chloroflexota bacterium]
MDKNQYKPRFREIVENALGNVIGAILLVILGITAGGITIGWMPTFIFATVTIGGLALWYRFDPNLRGLIRQRFFKIRHAVSGQSVIMSRWNLITEETIAHIIRQNHLAREYLRLEQSRIIKFNSLDHLELILNYVGDKKWLSLTNSTGTVVDLYGGFKAVAGECTNCGAAILVRYGMGKTGKYVSEPSTICRRCKHQMTLSVISFEEPAVSNISVKAINKVDVQPREGEVWVHIEFAIENTGETTRICPNMELKIATLKNGNYIDHIAHQRLSPIVVTGHSTMTKSFDWKFPFGTIILVQKPNYLVINLPPC